MDTQRLLNLVKATAAAIPDPASPDRTKWLLIWCCDLVGELGEFITAGQLNGYGGVAYIPSDGALVEAGDCLWGMAAVSLASGVPLPFAGIPSADIHPVDALCCGLGLLDHLKKVARDGIELETKKRPLVA